MRNKALVLVLVGAVIFGLIAAVSVSRLLAGPNPGSGSNVVVVAKMEIPLGARIVAEQVGLVQMPNEVMPEGAFTSIEKAVGRVTTTKIAPREPITETRLAPDGSAAGLSALIPEGYRAMTVKVDDEAGIAGFLMPGTLVDVLAVINPPSENSGQNPISKIVLQNIKVLASGQNLDQAKDGRDPISVKTATLLVTPEQAEKLVLSSLDGKLRLALRNSVDQGDQQTPGANKNTLLTGEQANPVPDVRPSSEATDKSVAAQRTAGTRRSGRYAQRNPARAVYAGISQKAELPAQAVAPPPKRNSVDVYEGAKRRAIDFP